MAEEKVRPPSKLTLDVFKRSLSRWHIYVFVFCYMCVFILLIPQPTTQNKDSRRKSWEPEGAIHSKFR